MTIVLTAKMIVGMVIGFVGVMASCFMCGVAFCLDYDKKEENSKPKKETSGRYPWGRG